MGVLNQLKTVLNTKTTFKAYFVGEKFDESLSVPVLLIDTESTPLSPLAQDQGFNVDVAVKVVLLKKTSTPETWLTECAQALSDAMDIVLADRTLGGLVNDAYPSAVRPGEVTLGNRTFFGGTVDFTFKAFFFP